MKGFVARQLFQSKRQAFVLVLCVALAITAIVALSGLQENVRESVADNAKELQAGDVLVRADNPFSDSLNHTIQSLPYPKAQYYELLTIVRTQNQSLLSNLKVVEPKYPFYGEVSLQSGRPFREVLTNGTAVVEQALLERLGIVVGENISIGEAEFTIVDVVIREPDRPIELFSLGPRVFLSTQNKDDLGLFIAGSRIEYRLLLQVPDEDIAKTVAILEQSAGERERVRSYENAGGRVLRFLDNLLFFLNMLAIFILLLSGLAMQSTLNAYLKERTETVAIMRTVGATGGYVTRKFLLVVLILGVLGTVLGIIFGIIVQFALPALFAELLPEAFETSISLQGIVQGATLGILVVLLFAILPLSRLRDTKPVAIFRIDKPQRSPKSRYLVLALIVSLFIAFILLRLEDTAFAIVFIAGILILVGVAFGITEFVLRGIRACRPTSLVARQAIRGLFRPKNATRAIIITLSASLAFLFSIFLMQATLNKSFVETYPPGSPNLLALDIQPQQVEAFQALMEGTVEVYPLVTGRIIDINGEPIDRERERERIGDNLGREFRLTYRENLIENERIIKGDSLFGNSEQEGIPVSIHQDIVDISGLALGDTLTFNVQGLPITAYVSSIRDSGEGTISPFFYFVFQPEVLQNAPQTIFAAGNVDNPINMQNRIAREFPTVTTIDVTQVIETFSVLLERLTRIVNFFTLFAVLAGLLLIVGSVLATVYERTQEATYYRILGSTKRFVWSVFILENTIIGGVSALIGMAIAHAITWYIITRMFSLEYSAFAGESGLLILTTILVVVTIGLLASWQVLRKKPIAFLREHTEE